MRDTTFVPAKFSCHRALLMASTRFVFCLSCRLSFTSFVFRVFCLSCLLSFVCAYTATVYPFTYESIHIHMDLKIHKSCEPRVLQCASCTTVCLVCYSVPRVLQCASCVTVCLVCYSVPPVLQCASCTTVYLLRYSVLRLPQCGNFCLPIAFITSQVQIDKQI